MDNLRSYTIQMCKCDGSTPVDEKITTKIDASDGYAALGKFYREFPGYEVVSFGLTDEIEAYEQRVRDGSI